jgi:steroid delta-isomerase-like uncharacterized protein
MSAQGQNPTSNGFITGRVSRAIVMWYSVLKPTATTPVPANSPRVPSSQRDIAMKLALPVLLAALIGSPAHAQTAQDNRRDVVLWYEAFDQKNPALLDQILAPEWVDIPSPPGVPPGPAGAKRTLAMLTTSFPDLRIIVEDIIQDGDKVVVRSTISGTQRAEFVGIRAQGRRLSIQAVDIHEFKDGKILRTWHTEDWMTGLNQLGAFER